MERGSTLFLKGVVVLLGLIVFAVCSIWLPMAVVNELKGDFDYLPILLGMYVAAVPFFIALFQGMKLLNLIDKNKAFTQAAVNTLKNIKYCGLSISGLYLAGIPYIFYVADQDDAPGLVALGFVIIGASFVIAIAASLFAKLFQNAVDIKSENDLTV